MTRQFISYVNAIVSVIKNNNGIATTKQILEQISKFRPLTGKTPEATILSELGRNRKFAKIGAGVWSLAENKNNFSEINNLSFQKDLEIISKENNADNKELALSTERLHAQIQGMLLEIGNVNGFQTYTPNKNSTFNNKPLKNLATISEIPSFTYNRIIRAVRHIDVLWFTEDKEPFPAFAWEVENSTNFRDGLIKFTELNFFKTKFYFLAPENKINKFKEEIARPIFKNIEKSCDFYSIERVKQSYQSTLDNEELRIFNYDKKI
ncbi:hypothetical protein HZB06_01040 [Candidatus Wolfebacteria bacterium]|nr:hypothetical protein [Candidatus Wolfebacteria bacterium]